jgi:hypothetical protein
MRFRPTASQVLGRGACLGALVGLGLIGGLALLGALGVLTEAGLTARLGVPPWLALAAPLAVGPVVGGGLAVLFGRDEGADVDDYGIRTIPSTADGDAPWHRIEDLRAERRGARTHVAVYLDSGQILRLPAPYDGGITARDPQFERKLFMLRHLWETHRSFVLPNQPLDGV